MPAVDDIELVRQLLAVPGPRADVTAAGRASLDALAAREAEERGPLRRGSRAAGRPQRPVLPTRGRAAGRPQRPKARTRTRTRTRVALTCGAVVAAIVATAATLVALRPGTDARLSTGPGVTVSPTAGRSGAPAPKPASVQLAILAAVTTARGDILYFRQSSQGTGPTVDVQEWFWPSQPVPGRPVHMLVVEPTGLEIESTFTAAAGDQYTAGKSTGPAITGTEVIVDPQAKTWSNQRGAVILPRLPTPTSVLLLRGEIAAHVWTVLGPTKLAGQPAIELTTTRAGANGLRERLWVNARSYLPMRLVKQNWSGAGSTLQYDFEYLPATPAALATLTPAIPPGYERVSAP
jgi:hypothetical protein